MENQNKIIKALTTANCVINEVSKFQIKFTNTNGISLIVTDNDEAQYLYNQPTYCVCLDNEDEDGLGGGHYLEDVSHIYANMDREEVELTAGL